MAGIDTTNAFTDGLELTFVEMIGDYGAKVQNPWLAFGGYNALAYKLTSALNKGSLIVVNSYWDGLSNIMTTVLGYAMGERPNQQQWLGIIFISLGIFMLNK